MHILAGLYKGRGLLSPPAGSDTRPVTGLVKKSLFGMIGPLLPEATVLDLYCGTGTLGLEALSQGAAKCYFAERDRRVLERLRENIQALGVADRCVVWGGDVAHGLAGWLDPLDLRAEVVFVDPPFEAARQWDWAEVEGNIFGPLTRHLSGNGVVALRLPGRVEAPERIGGLAIRKSRDYGDMSVVLLAAEEKRT
jgi:16S rRNA (guanine(966)-N(2))-methyltransferase RsmD